MIIEKNMEWMLHNLTEGSLNGRSGMKSDFAKLPWQKRVCNFIDMLKHSTKKNDDSDDENEEANSTNEKDETTLDIPDDMDAFRVYTKLFHSLDVEYYFKTLKVNLRFESASILERTERIELLSTMLMDSSNY